MPKAEITNSHMGPRKSGSGWLDTIKILAALDLYHPSPLQDGEYISVFIYILFVMHRGPCGILSGSWLSSVVGDSAASFRSLWRPTKPCESASLVPRGPRTWRTAPQLGSSFWAYFLVLGRPSGSLFWKQEPSGELWCEYLLSIEGYQNMPPQNTPLQHLNYFELRSLRTSRCRKSSENRA